MTLDEAHKLVRFLAALDGRKVHSDSAHAFHQMLGQYDYVDAKRATETAAKNTPRDYCTIAEIVSVLHGQAHRAGLTTTNHCNHGVPKPGYCHDCTHKLPCDLCSGTT